MQSEDTVVVQLQFSLMHIKELVSFKFIFFFCMSGGDGKGAWEGILFAGYHATARPVMQSEDTVVVQLQFSIMHIKELVSISPLI